MRSRAPSATGGETADPISDLVPAGYLGRLRLLVALDALLVEGSVSRAAERLGIGTPAMSRLLGQIRAFYNDPIMERTGRGMVPTAFAEQLRLRVRAVAAASEALFEDTDPRERATGQTSAPPSLSPPMQYPPLAMRPSIVLDGQPLPTELANKLSKISQDAEPRHRLAKYIALTGAGVGNSRPLTAAEAEDAFSIILDGNADPIQIGAFLVVLQYRGLNTAELSGMVAAGRFYVDARSLGSATVDLDWPAYVSPKVMSAPWFLHAARLVSRAGYTVLMHGLRTDEGQVSLAMRAAGLPIYRSLDEAETSIAKDRIGYLPLTAFGSQLYNLSALYRLFEMRSPLNMVIPLLNPLGAKTTVLGVPNASDRKIHRDAAQALGWSKLCAIGTSRDVAQATPFRVSTLFRLDGSVADEAIIGSTPAPKSEAVAGLSSLDYWRAVWTGCGAGRSRTRDRGRHGGHRTLDAGRETRSGNGAPEGRQPVGRALSRSSGASRLRGDRNGLDLDLPCGS
jgi:anthranilate phosphoribosyltransferase